MVTRRKAVHLNVVGDFYVEDECCLACGVPEDIAPGLFGSVMEHDQCFVKEQPASRQDLELMFEVMATQDIGCVRYGGSNPAIIQRLQLIDPGSVDLLSLPKPAAVASPTKKTRPWWRVLLRLD